jgi:hypothetical protein
MSLDYRFEARLTDTVEIGPGSVVLDIRETNETDRGAISADVRGYAIPRSGRAVSPAAA